MRQKSQTPNTKKPPEEVPKEIVQAMQGARKVLKRSSKNELIDTIMQLLLEKAVNKSQEGKSGN